MFRMSLGVRIVCVVVLMMCAAGGGRAGGVPPLTISEFRLRGPAGATDEFIEVYNYQLSPHTVAAASGTGYGIAASDGTTRCTIPNGTVIPARGHFLCVNASGYSLASVPAGTGTTASGDATYTLDIPDNAGIALFDNNTGGASYSSATRVDAVGSTSESNALYREGAGYSPLPVPLPNQSAWVRRSLGSCAGGPCTPQSSPVYDPLPLDLNNNASDFYYTDTTGSVSLLDGSTQHLGAPGPENLGSPVSVGGGNLLFATRVSGCSSSDAPPNRVRSFVPGPDPANAPLGILDLRVKWKNNTATPITRLRFRVVDVTNFPVPPGTADLRVLSSAQTSFTLDNWPCGATDGSDFAVGSTVEQPPSPIPGGGGLNSTLSVGVTPAAALGPFTSLNVRVVLGIVQNGFARFCIVPETTPAVGLEPWCYIGSTDTPAAAPAAGDYDFDHAADMPAYDPATARWTIRQSSSGFASEIVNMPGSPGGIPVPGDYDGDGRYDLAVYRKTGVWSIVTSRSDYSRIIQIPSRGGPEYDPVPGDYDGDGTTDLAVASASRHTWTFWPSSSTSGASYTRDFAGAGFTPVAGQDFDGDGRTDMVLYNENRGLWAHRPSSSDFTVTILQSWGGPGYTLVPGDYDGDHRSDYGVYQRTTGAWFVLLSGGSSPYTTGFSGSWGGPGFVPVPADYDGDRRIDVAVYQASATRWLALRSSTSYSTLLASTFGTTSDRPLSAAVLPPTAREIHASDFDGDAVSEIAAYHTTTGIWSGLGSTDNFMAPSSRSWGGTGYTAVPGDYDGDGLVDLAFYQAATGQWQVLRSDNLFTTTYVFSGGGPGYVPVAADYDGDGRTDMIVYNTATGLWYGGKSSTDFTTTLSISWGGTGYTPAPGDFDGDGKADLSVYQEASGNWLILTSSSNFTSGLFRSYGGPGYTPIPADFDGDGLTDIAVYRAATGLWTVLRSATGNTLGFSLMYGGAGYTPVAGDWDGDRRADIGVYNAAGSWSILLSGSGYTASLSRTLGGAGQVPLTAFR